MIGAPRALGIVLAFSVVAACVRRAPIAKGVEPSAQGAAHHEAMGQTGPRAPVLRGEHYRLAVLEAAPWGCRVKTLLLFALFDTRLAFRRGDPCVEADAAYRVVELRPADWKWFHDEIAYNPLIAGAPREVDYCPHCLGRGGKFERLSGRIHAAHPNAGLPAAWPASSSSTG